MKKILLTAVAAIVAIATFNSCKKEENTAVLKSDPGAAVLSAPAATLAIDSLVHADSTAYDFKWVKADYGVNVATNYSLQIAKHATDLGKSNDSAFVYTISGATNRPVTNGEMRLLGIGSKVAEGVVATYYARVISALAGNSSIAPLVGAVKSFNMSYYNTPLARLYVPGNYQNWTPSAAPFLTGINGTGIFSGLIEKSKADGTLSDGKFKFTSIPDWVGTNYGADPSDPTKLSTDGSANDLNLVDGTYFFNVNTNTLKWKSELRSWGLIGDATPGVWASDQNMRYNADTKLYEITLDLIVGSIKLRYNDGWAENRGWTAASGNGDGVELPLGVATASENNGKNFGVVAPGNYTITFDPATDVVKIIKN
jgi:starch-binding outer membrane protein SusE/F